MTDEQHQAVRDMVENRLTLHKNVRWEMADYDVPTEPDRVVTDDIAEAEVVSSKHSSAFTFGDAGGLHDLLIDIDVPAVLVPSSTSDHFHLYVPLACQWADYLAFLKAAARIGLVEDGYVKASEKRGHTSLRLPWVKKGRERDAVSLPPKRTPFPAMERPF